MKNKKILISIVSAVSIILIVGIGIGIVVASADNTPSQLSMEIEKKNRNWQIGDMEALIEKELNIPLENLPVCKDFPTLKRYAHGRGSFRYLSSICDDIDWLNCLKTRVDYIQPIDSEHVAAVYKVSENNYGEAYMFIVLEREVDEKRNKERWNRIGELYFLDKVHNYDEYSLVEVGDSMEELYDIDGTIRYDVLLPDLSYYYRLEYDKFREENGGVTNADLQEKAKELEHYDYRMIYKVLSDGVLRIEYNSNDMKISEIKFYSYSEGQQCELTNIKDDTMIQGLISD